LLYLNNKSLERAKAGHQKDLELRKAEYQQQLESRKSELQTELEGRKLTLQKELEHFKAEIADELATQNARRAYEYDARKRLYAQVEPLLFQLFEAAEGGFHAVTSLVRTQRMGHLPEWLSATAHRYYIRSIIHRLFLPLAIFRLIQRSTTLVDLNLDPSIRLRYALLKESYLTWTDDFGLAQLEPALCYRPHEVNWSKLRQERPQIYWRQGLVIGNLDRLVDAMVVVDGSSPRPMNFGEWETALNKDEPLKPVYLIVEDIFPSFEFRSRLILGRLLMTYACMMHTLMSVYGMPTENLDLAKLVSELLDTKERNDILRWWDGIESDIFTIIRPYVLRRLKQATVGGYAKF
jgi:hypothetical protein